MKFVLKSILIIFLQISIVVAITNVCQFMMENKKTKNKCKMKSIKLNTKLKRSECICSDMSVEFTLTNSSRQKIFKSNDSLDFQVYFKNKKPAILDKNVKIFNQNLFNLRSRKFLRFRFVKGFDVDSFNFTLRSYGYIFTFFESFFSFYLNGKILKTCEHFPSQPRSLFQDFLKTTISFLNSNYKQICPLAFLNSQIGMLSLVHVIDSFYKTNIPSFTDLPKDISNINSNINILNLFGFGGITLNRRIINPHVFNHTTEFAFLFEILAIEKETFKSLAYIKEIQIFQHYWRKLFHKGIEWIHNMNSHIKVDLNDSELIQSYIENKSYLTIFSELNYRKMGEGVSKNILKETYPDEDFCIYANFPLDQLVIVYFPYPYMYDFKMTCTFAWLIQYIFYFPKDFINKSQPVDFRRMRVNNKELEDISTKCNFLQR